MKNSGLTQRILFGSVLVLLSVFFYSLHFAIFHDAHHIWIYLIGDIAFVFIEVLLVTLIIHHILSEREKRAMLQKLNMVIGAFFSEVGTPLLTHFTVFDASAPQLAGHMIVDENWSPEHFGQMGKVLKSHTFKIDAREGDLDRLKKFLVGKRQFLLGLLENPNLLEHELFTELLWAVFHLTEELSCRTDINSLPDNDYKHLAGDIERAHRILVREWLSHMQHLKEDYPYLFSLAVRTNPFDPNTSPEVQ